MTRKDFELIAGVIQDQRDHRAATVDDQKSVLDAVAKRLADKLSTTNPNFNRDRFLRAAGVEV